MKKLSKHQVKKAKAQTELNWARDTKGNKKNFSGGCRSGASPKGKGKVGYDSY